MTDPSTEAIREADEIYDPYPDIQWVPAPCQKACPVGTDASSYIGLIWEDRLEEAFEAIIANNPFSSVCGRVCAKPCEPECRRGESDAPVAIRNLKRFVMDRLGHDFHLSPVPVTRSQTVGIVGGGPTGLTTAQDLAEAGYEVYVYEMKDSLGGMMYTIPEFRLPRNFIEDDINRLLKHCPGVKVHLNCALGSEVTLEKLKERHDAVLLSTGLWQDRRLGVPGEIEGLQGLYGINFLTQISEGSKITVSGKALVVGGGNVAMDMARTVLRVGAQEVQLFCLETREEMPAWKHEIEEAEREGVIINTSWGPKQILQQNGRVAGVEFMRCVSVFDGEGRFNPTYDESKTMMVDAEAVFLAIGLQTANSELDRFEMISRGLVKADFATMRTADPKVFAAGDCAFGPSAIVHAMHHGHRASYYMKAFLEGREKPLPYRTPFRTRRVPVAQDPLWETLPREEQPFHGLGQDPAAFAECESTYDPATANRQAARCLRCDAETGSSDYSRRTREHIHTMARTQPGDIERLREILLERLKPRENPFPPDRSAHLDDLVFLSAALTRLVIDPYREACSTRTLIGRTLTLEQPFLFAGFDDAPEEVRRALALGLRSTGCGYVGLQPLITGSFAQSEMSSDGNLPWLQLVIPGRSEPQADADGLIYVTDGEFDAIPAERQREGQLLGLALATPSLERGIPFALDQGYEVLLLDGSEGLERPWSELMGYPDLTVMRDAISILRRLNREEEISLIYFGGMRSGTDVAKALAINCNAAVFSVPMAIAVGGVIDGDHIAFSSDRSIEERLTAAENWIKATAQETAIIARCTGKTNVHNLEPEDMRSITLTTSEASDIPMASGRERREGF